MRFIFRGGFIGISFFPSSSLILFYNYACFLLLRGMELEQDGTGLGLGHWRVWYRDKASASGVF